GALLRRDGVALGVLATDDEGGRVLVGLHDVGAEGRGDDAGQARPCAELEQALAAHAARGELVREGDGGGPERDAVGEARLVAAQEALFVFVAQDRAGVQDGPGVAVERQAVFFEREVAGGGGEDGWRRARGAASEGGRWRLHRRCPAAKARQGRRRRLPGWVGRARSISGRTIADGQPPPKPGTPTRAARAHGTRRIRRVPPRTGTPTSARTRRTCPA